MATQASTEEGPVTPLDIRLDKDYRVIPLNMTRTGSGAGDVRLDLGFVGPINDEKGINQAAGSGSQRAAATVYATCYMTANAAKALAQSLLSAAKTAENNLQRPTSNEK